jgi:hypothetical protein
MLCDEDVTELDGLWSASTIIPAFAERERSMGTLSTPSIGERVHFLSCWTRRRGSTDTIESLHALFEIVPLKNIGINSRGGGERGDRAWNTGVWDDIR